MARFQDRSGMSDSVYQGTSFDEDEDRGSRQGDRFGPTGDEPTVGYRVPGGRTTNRAPWVEIPSAYFSEGVEDAAPGEPWGGPMYAHMYMLERTQSGDMNTDRWRPAWELSERPDARDWRGLYDEEEERRTRERARRPEGPYRGVGPRGYVRRDERIHDEVCHALTDDPLVDATDVSIEVKDGEVTLQGTVEDRDQKRRAEDVAWDVSGVRDVHNRICLQGRGERRGERG